MHTMYLIRGVPGSGKSTAAKQLSELHGIPVFETDDFFIKDGNYTFDRSKIGMAHNWNQARTLKRISKEMSCIVSNTLTTKDECLTYIKIANTSSTIVEILEPKYPVWIEVSQILNDPSNKTEAKLKPFAKKFYENNIHNVPEETILKMLLRWTPTAEIKKYLKE